MTDIKRRIERLENQNPERPLKPIYQDWDNPALWFDNTDRVPGESIPWDEMAKRYPNHDFIQVQYTNNWRGTNDDQ
jgi:hypothetical protein